MNAGLVIVLLFGMALTVWKVSVVIFPDKTCRFCNGKGFRGFKSIGRPCGECHGSGRMKRIGAK